ncbi:glycoside hydrolase family 9 protein [Actinoplanes auranticolor]|uniref:Glycoside hydrolase family 9 domain-containing protein n=1 Tax=Actinoplanes auranticolor TaxID=47988 RepID=A0A919SUJ9_9ACTN|nr:glycoside hydrolase family 9 protein [Actinoplanes auranticolor]GIM78239.1 hypothetical protein Aau02nite_79900 [Actinoplanes auranticolor]
MHRIDLTSLTRPGTYRLRVQGPVTAESPAFRVAPATELFAPLVGNAPAYFQAHRGTSLVVAAGTTVPRCPHDQIAGLTPGSPAPGMTGAVVNGPNRADRIRDPIESRGRSSCSTGAFAAFDREDTHYTDDERVSATTEPSLDFTATGMLAFALTARGL